MIEMDMPVVTLQWGVQSYVQGRSLPVEEFAVVGRNVEVVDQKEADVDESMEDDRGVGAGADDVGRASIKSEGGACRDAKGKGREDRVLPVEGGAAGARRRGVQAQAADISEEEELVGDRDRLPQE